GRWSWRTTSRNEFGSLGCDLVTPSTTTLGAERSRRQGATCDRDRPTGDADESYPGGRYLIHSGGTSKESTLTHKERPPGMTRAAIGIGAVVSAAWPEHYRRIRDEPRGRVRRRSVVRLASTPQRWPVYTTSSSSNPVMYIVGMTSDTLMRSPHFGQRSTSGKILYSLITSGSSLAAGRALGKQIILQFKRVVVRCSTFEINHVHRSES